MGTTTAFSLVLILGQADGSFEVVWDPRPIPREECQVEAEEMTGGIAVLSDGSRHYVWLATCRAVPSAGIVRVG